jgi:hypothetical protein
MENTSLPPTQITVADLDALRGIVDIAAQRGAFRGAELAQVGAVYDKLTTFLNSVVAQAKADAEAADTESTEETAPADSTQGG